MLLQAIFILFLDQDLFFYIGIRVVILTLVFNSCIVVIESRLLLGYYSVR